MTQLDIKRGQLLLVVLFCAFLFVQISFYWIYVDRIDNKLDDKMLRHKQIPAGESFEQAPGYEYLSLRQLDKEGALQLGLVVRAHAGYAAHLASLMWSLKAQEFPERKKQSITLIVVVPTEPGDATVLNEYISHYTDAYVIQNSGNHLQSQQKKRRNKIRMEEIWARRLKDPGRKASHNNMDSAKSHDVLVAIMDPTLSDYEAQSQVLSKLCTDSWRQDRLRSGWPSSALDRYCSVNSPVHYHLTDLGVEQLLQLVPHLPFFVVTNADNYYSPRFFSAVLSFLQGEDGEGQYDIAMVDMVHRGQVMLVKPEVGRMDLGCVVMRTSLLSYSNDQEMDGGVRKTQVTFGNSLPTPAAPENWHDADFWFVDSLIRNRNARVGLLHEVLFVHN